MQIYTTEEFMKSNESIHICKCGTAHHALHTHGFIEIVYILSGKMTQVINGSPYEVKRGDILFMNYGCTHTFYSDTSYSYVNILFSPELLSENIVTAKNAFSVLSLTTFNEMRSDSDFGRVEFIGSERDEIEQLIDSMLDEYGKKLTACESVLCSYLNILIIKMLRKHAPLIKEAESDGTWQALREYIDTNLDSKLTLSDLAKKCFYNPSYFSRAFKEKFGMTLMEYIVKKRIEHATYLLSSTELSIDDICTRVGFSDKNSLYHAFSRHLGKTPMYFRKGQK